MALTIDGANKLIILDTATTWNFHDIYVALQDWAMLSANMKYVLPCQGSGKIDLGGSVATDSIYKIMDGWNLKPSGYSSGDTITIVGTVVAEDGSRTVPPTTGANPTWVFQVATQGVVTSVGSGLTTEEHDELFKNTSIKANTDIIPALL